MTINCSKCKQPISSKSDLSTAWFFFKILTYHNGCFSEEKTKGKGIFLSGPINGRISTFLTILISLFTIVFITLTVLSNDIRNIFTIIVLFIQLSFLAMLTYPRILSYFFYERNLNDNYENIKKSITEEPTKFEQRSSEKVYCKTCEKEIKDVSSLIVSFHVVKYDICTFHTQCFSKELKKGTAGIKYFRTPINSTEYFMKYGLKGFITSGIIGIIGLSFVFTGIYAIVRSMNSHLISIDVPSVILSLVGAPIITALLIFQISGNYIIFTRKAKKITQKIENAANASHT